MLGFVYWHELTGSRLGRKFVIDKELSRNRRLSNSFSSGSRQRESTIGPFVLECVSAPDQTTPCALTCRGRKRSHEHNIDKKDAPKRMYPTKDLPQRINQISIIDGRHKQKKEPKKGEKKQDTSGSGTESSGVAGYDNPHERKERKPRCGHVSQKRNGYKSTGRGTELNMLRWHDLRAVS